MELNKIKIIKISAAIIFSSIIIISLLVLWQDQSNSRHYSAPIQDNTTGFSDIVMFFPIELQKNINEIGIVYNSTGQGFYLSDLSSRIENISKPQTNTLVTFRFDGWDHDKVELAEMASPGDAERVFESYKELSEANQDTFGDKKCLSYEASDKQYAFCKKDNLIFRIQLPKDKDISEIGNIHPYDSTKDLEELIEKHNPSIFNASITKSFISLKGEKGHEISDSTFSLKDLPQIGNYYKPDMPDEVVYYKGVVFFCDNQSDCKSRFDDFLDFLNSTILPYNISNFYKTKSLEYVSPGTSVAEYRILGYKGDIFFVSVAKVSGSFVSLPQLPHKPPELPTNDTEKYIKFMTKQLFKNLVTYYS